MPKNNHKGRSSSKRYFGIPYTITECANFIKLSAQANKLLIDIGRQFRGSNNGDLCATWSVMSLRGWKSRETLNDALRELEYYGFIVVTQYGNRKLPTLYALTWLKVDKSKKDTGITINQVPSGWRDEKAVFIKPSSRRLSKRAKQKKPVTLIACQTDTDSVSNDSKLRVVQ